jgi:hypothetical protein
LSDELLLTTQGLRVAGKDFLAGIRHQDLYAALEYAAEQVCVGALVLIDAYCAQYAITNFG